MTNKNIHDTKKSKITRVCEVLAKLKLSHMHIQLLSTKANMAMSASIICI